MESLNCDIVGKNVNHDMSVSEKGVSRYTPESNQSTGKQCDKPVNGEVSMSLKKTKSGIPSSISIKDVPIQTWDCLAKLM